MAYKYKQLEIYPYKSFSILPTSSGSPYLGYVYIVRLEDCIKIGSTKNPRTRIGNLLNIFESYGKRKVISVAVSIPHVNYKGNEVAMHRSFDGARIGGVELFHSEFDAALSMLDSLDFDLDEDKIPKENHKIVERLVRQLAAPADLMQSLFLEIQEIFDCIQNNNDDVVAGKIKAFATFISNHIEPNEYLHRLWINSDAFAYYSSLLELFNTRMLLCIAMQPKYDTQKKYELLFKLSGISKINLPAYLQEESVLDALRELTESAQPKRNAATLVCG